MSNDFLSYLPWAFAAIVASYFAFRFIWIARNALKRSRDNVIDET